LHYRGTLFLLLLVSGLQAQKLQSVWWHLRYHPHQAHFEIRAEVAFTDHRPGQSLELLLHPSHQMGALRWKEGRLKERLPYTFSEGRVIWQAPENVTPATRYELFYQVPFDTLKATPYFQLVSQGWAVNALNYVEREPDYAEPGFLLPASQSGNDFNLFAALTLPSQWQAVYPGEETWTLEGEEENTHFFEAKNFSPAAFYLVAGTFDNFQVRKLSRDYDLTFDEPEALRMKVVRSELSDYLAYLSGKSAYLFLDNDWERISEAQAGVAAGFLWQSPDARTWREQAAALLAAQGDTQRAAAWHLTWLQNTRGKAWLDTWLLNAYQQGPPRKRLFWEHYLNLFLRPENLRLSDTTALTATANYHSRREALLALARWSYRERKVFPLHLQYRYRSDRSQLELIAKGPSAGPPVAVPLTLSLNTTEGLERRYLILHPQYGDTLAVALAESPQSADARATPHAPLHIDQEKPVTYWLYNLTAAESPEEKETAIEVLLEQASPRLLATVVGLALDSDRETLQEKALEAFPRVPSYAHPRLKQNLIDLTESTNPSLSQMARDLIGRYYP